jgi:hypothetical protein
MSLYAKVAIPYIGLAIINLVWFVYLQFLPKHDTLANYLFNFIYALPPLIGGVTGMVISRRYGGLKSVVGSMLALIGAGIFFFGVGNLVWTYDNIWGGEDVPSPGLSDIFYLLYYVFMIPGVVHFLGNSGSKKAQYRLMFSLPIAMVITGLILAALWTNSTQGDFGLTVVNTAYTAGDAILLTLSIAALTSLGGSLGRAVFCIMLGAAIAALADMYYVNRTINDTYWNGDISDGLFALSGFIESSALIFYVFWSKSIKPAIGLPPKAPETLIPPMPANK